MRVLQGLLGDVENGVGCLPRSIERKAVWLGSGGLAKAADSTESDQPGESRLKRRGVRSDVDEKKSAPI